MICKQTPLFVACLFVREYLSSGQVSNENETPNISSRITSLSEPKMAMDYERESDLRILVRLLCYAAPHFRQI